MLQIRKKIYSLSDMMLLLYLVSPYIFFALYLRNLLSILLAVLVVIFIAVIVWKTDFKKLRINKWWLLISLLFSILVCLLVGIFPAIIGGEQPDWLKHNTILNDLFIGRWPIEYFDGSMLNYYLGMYLAPAFIGKIFDSFLIAKACLSLYLFTGIFLSFYKFVEIFKTKKKIFILLILIFFVGYSGWDWLSNLIRLGYIPSFPNHIEWGAGNVQLSSIVTLISWVPQHFIPALMGVLLLKNFNFEKIIIIPLVLLWSPFAAIGLALVFVVKCLGWIIMEKKKILMLLKEYWSTLLFGILLAIPFLFFYYHHLPQGFSPVFVGWDTVLRFSIAEILPLSLIVFFSWKDKQGGKNSIIFLIGIVIICMFSWGSGFNDFAMRVPVALLLIILLEIGEGLEYLLENGMWYKLLPIVIIWIGGLITPVSEIVRLVEYGKKIVEPLNSILDMGEYTKQYLGIGW